MNNSNLNVRVEGNKLIIKDYYDERVKTTIKVVDIWSKNKRECANMLEFMYNNPNQPFSPCFKNGEQWVKLGGYINGSKCNQVKVLGSMKEIWKEFEKSLNNVKLEDLEMEDVEEMFWEFYTTNYSENFKCSVKMLEDYVRNKRSRMTDKQREIEKTYYPELTDEKWIHDCSDCLKYLIKTKTVRGFMIETVFFKTISEFLGGTFIESTEEMEKMGIDGFISLNGTGCWYPVCLKPSTFCSSNCVSPIFEDRYVMYERKEKDLVFKFKTGMNLLIDTKTA